MINSQISESELQLSRFIRDLFDHNEQLIKQGEINFEREDFQLNYIVVSEISSVALAIPKTFDSVDENMSYGVSISATMTIDFFGKDSNTNKLRFFQLANSQKGYELQRDMRLTVSNPSGNTNLKQLTGAQYSPRFQLSLNIRYTESLDVPTLRIDTAEVETIFDA